MSPLDTAFLYMERPEAPMHLGALTIFEPSESRSPERLAGLLVHRARRIPRLHKRIRRSWLPPWGAEWTDDLDFDAARHIHTHRLSRPMAADELADWASDRMSEPLATDRPLWQLHLVTGLPQGRFAVLVKLHHALCDAMSAIGLGLGLLDGFDPQITQPEPADGHPASVLDAVRQAKGSLDIAWSVLRSARLPAPPLAARSSGDRQLRTVRLDMADLQQVRRRHGGTLNDVVLTVLSGALRLWLAGRGGVVDGRHVRALIPVNQRTRPACGAGANQLSGYLCDLPVYEPDPVARLRAVRSAMDRNKASGPTRGAGAVPLLADRLPTLMHRIATPIAGQVAPVFFDTVVTAVRLPDLSLRLDGAGLAEIHPIVPLAANQALATAVLSYRGGMYVCLHADREAVPDVGKLVEAVDGALVDLRERSA